MRAIRLVCGLLAVACAAPAGAAPEYRLVAIAPMSGGTYVDGQSINNAGQVAGYGDSPTGTAAFRWDVQTNTSEHLGYLRDNRSLGFGINDAGQVAGHSGNAARPFRWDPSGGMSELPADRIARGFGINDSGAVAGHQQDASGNTVAHLWRPNPNNNFSLGDLPGGRTRSLASEINNAGQVVGTSEASTGDRAFLWTLDDGIQDLGDLAGGADESSAADLNDQGQVVGTSEAAGGQRAFLWDVANGMQNLGTLPGQDRSLASAINAGGQVVGWSGSPFLWDEGNGMRRLDSLVDSSGDNWQFLSANDISDHGWIVGWGRRASGQLASFVLIPIPEPGTALLLTAGLCGCLLPRRHRKA